MIEWRRKQMATDTPAGQIQGNVITRAGASHTTGEAEQTSTQVFARIGAGAAFLGALFLLISTFLHPSGSHPNEHHAAFAEYAADSFWIWSHLGQFLGFAGLAVALGALALTFEAGRPAAWGRVGLIGTLTLLAVAAVLQAVDGIALKVMVDHWAATTGDVQSAAFEATYAVRQVEIGLASFLSLVSGLTMLVFGVAIVLSKRYPTWLGGLALVGGLGAIAGGLAQAVGGFSDLAMALSMPASLVLIVWAITTGVLMWRLAPRLSSQTEAS
jgi:hypothetical protein